MTPRKAAPLVLAPAAVLAGLVLLGHALFLEPGTPALALCLALAAASLAAAHRNPPPLAPLAAANLLGWAGVAGTSTGFGPIPAPLASGALACAVLGLLAGALGPQQAFDERLQRLPLPTLVVLPVTALYVVHLSWKHRTFQTWAIDDGLFAQALWHLGRGEPPASSLRELPNLWGDHFTPVLALLAPAYRCFPEVSTLLVLQALAVAGGAWAVAGIAGRALGSPTLAAAAALGYLASVPMQNSLHFGFHPVTLAIPLLLAATRWAMEQRWKAMAAALALASLTQEDALLAVAFFGLALAASGAKGSAPPAQRRLGLAVALAAATCLLAVLLVVIPWFAGPDRPYGYYGGWGGSPAEVLGRLLGHPWETLRALADPPAKLQTLFVQAVPGLFLFLLSPWSLTALPLLAENHLSDRPSQWELGYHYAAPAAALLLAASLDGAGRLARSHPALRQALVGALTFTLLGTTALFTTSTNAPLHQRLTGQLPAPTEQDARRAALLRAVPEEASVIAQPALVTHLANRRQVQDDDPVSGMGGDPLVLHPADYVVYDLGVTTFPYDEAAFRQRVREVLTRGYGVERQEDTLLVLRRGAPGRPTGLWARFLEE